MQHGACRIGLPRCRGAPCIRIRTCGPTKSEVMRAMGHRSLTTTDGYLAILARKNWILPPAGGSPIGLN